MADKNRITKGQRVTEGAWRRADLHLHTPASADWQEPGVTFLQWLQKAESRGLDMVAITDHNTVEGVSRLRAEVERLTWLEANDRLRTQERRDLDEYRRIGEKLLVLPGFEFTATFGFHILAIFPPDTSVRMLELLLLRLNVPVDRLATGSTEVGATVDVLTAYRMIREAGGLVVAAHVNSTHGVAMRGVSFGGQTKIAFTQDPNLHALEVTDLESGGRHTTARFFDGSKPEYSRRMHCIQGSDAHRMVRDPKDKNRPGVGDRVTEFLLPELSFDALKSVLESDDFSLTRPFRPTSAEPFDHVQEARAEGNTLVQAFHENLVERGGRMTKVLADAVALANTRGGTVYVGISPVRKGQPKGVENANDAATALRNEIEQQITPTLDAKVDVVQSAGASIVRIIVPNGKDKPYALGQTRIYVRQEGETNEAVRDELVQMVLAARSDVSAGPVAPISPDRTRDAGRGGPRRGGRLPSQPQPQPPAIAAIAQQPAPLPPAQAGETAGNGHGKERELPQPGIGVEVLASDERNGARTFSIRDLRNGNVIHNVSAASARKLWSYAINQYSTNPVDPNKVTWSGDLGLWQVARRAKKLRYDLVQRQDGGGLRVFYGVTADGMPGPWQQFLKDEDRAE